MCVSLYLVVTKHLLHLELYVKIMIVTIYLALSTLCLELMQIFCPFDWCFIDIPYNSQEIIIDIVLLIY